MCSYFIVLTADNEIMKGEVLIKERKCTGKTFFPCFLGEEQLIIVQAAILLNIWLLKKRSVLSFAYYSETYGTTDDIH